MKITVLGSGAWEAIPSLFSQNLICKLAVKSPKSKNRRTRPGFLVETEAVKVMLEISPDIREQSARFNLPVIKDFLVSHWHFDHMYGILELDAWAHYAHEKPFNIFCSEKTNNWLEANFKHIRKQVNVVKAYQPFSIGDLKITPLPVKHMFSQDKDNFVGNNVFGYLFEHDGKRVAYLADYFEIPEKTMEIACGCDWVIADGTFLFQEDWPQNPETNLLRNDPDHVHGAKIIETVKKMDAKNTLFFSIAPLSELTHEQLQRKLPRGMKISYDGMTLSL